MLLLTSITDAIQIITGSAGTVDVHASWVDNASGALTPGRLNTAITTAATTAVSGTVPTSTQRNLQTLVVRNKHASSPNQITILHTDGTTAAQLFAYNLLAGETIEWLDGLGLRVLDANGNVKMVMNAAVLNGFTNTGLQINTLNGDQARVSQDASYMYTGSQSTLSAGTMYAAHSNQLVMWYFNHNTALDASGNFLARGDLDFCTSFGFGEDGTIRVVVAPSGNAGTVPAFSATPTWQLNQITGIQTLNGQVLNAGTTTQSPFKFTAGTNKTSTVAGEWEYDGVVAYFSNVALNRGAVLAEQFCMLAAAYTLTSQTAAQKLFNSSANGALTLPIGTYEFECEFSLTAMSATSGSFGFALGGTATFTQAWNAEAAKGATALATAQATQNSYNTAANVALATASVNTVGYAIIEGVIRVTVAGTIIPQVSLGIAAAAIAGINSFFRIRPLGNATVAAVGNWS